ncbi:MAG: hypothetical protein V4722_13405 [Bacteroidota bacterium]
MTPTITTALQLDQYIAELEIKKQAQEAELKETIKEGLEKLKPANLVKAVWTGVSTSPEIKEHLIDNGIGLAAGFVSKKLFVGKSQNPVKRLIGSLAQHGITNLVSNHPDAIKNIGVGLLRLIFKRKKKKDPEEETA